MIDGWMVRIVTRVGVVVVGLVMMAVSLSACGGDDGSDPAAPLSMTTVGQTTTGPITTVAPTPESAPPITTTTTTPPATTQAPEPAGIPLAAAEWEGEQVTTACVEVSQLYPGIDPPPDPPIESGLETLLDGLGLEVVDRDCDLSIRFDLSGEALSDRYGEEGVVLYAGATYQGEMTVSRPDHTEIVVAVSGRMEPTFATDLSRVTAAEAPWFQVWPDPILSGLSQMFGHEAVVSVIGSWPGDAVTFTWGYALSSGELNWVAAASEDIVPVLLELRNDTRVSDRAYTALGHLVAEDAVASDSQQQIVTALISDITQPDSDWQPAEGLSMIAWSPRFGPLWPGDDPGWYTDESGERTQRWDAEHWTEWRTSVGL